MALKGSRELRARLKAIRVVGKPIAKDWADATVPEAKRRIPVATGKTQASIRRRNASLKGATVVGNYPVNFIDAGAKEHDIAPKNLTVLGWGGTPGNREHFAKKVHKRRIAARPFKKESAEAGLRKVPMARRLIELWNRAA